MSLKNFDVAAKEAEIAGNLSAFLYLLNTPSVEKDIGDAWFPVRICALLSDQTIRLLVRYLALAWLDAEMRKETNGEWGVDSFSIMSNPKPHYAKTLGRACGELHQRLGAMAADHPQLSDALEDLAGGSAEEQLAKAADIRRLLDTIKDEA